MQWALMAFLVFFIRPAMIAHATVQDLAETGVKWWNLHICFKAALTGHALRSKFIMKWFLIVFIIIDI